MATWIELGGLVIAFALLAQQTAPAQQESSSSRSKAYRYPVEPTPELISDIFQFARLETEAVLFERLERESKLESIRASVRSANSRILASRRLLRLAGAFALENAVRYLGDSGEPSPQGNALQRARDAEAALSEAIRLLETLQKAAQEGGPNASDWLRVHRLIRIAALLLGPPGRERGLGTVGFLDLTGEQLDAAAAQLSQAIANLPDDDPRVQPLTATVQELRETAGRLDQLRTQCAMIVQQLETLRTEVFQPCAPTEGGERLQALFKAAFDAIPLLQQLHSDVRAAAERIPQLSADVQAVQQKVDTHTPATDAERDAWAILATAETQIDTVFLLLWDAEQVLKGHVTKTEEVPCPICGREHTRVMRVPDPVESCAIAQQRVAQAIEQLETLVLTADRLVIALKQARQQAPLAIDRHRVELALERLLPEQEGVGQSLTDDVNVAITRAEEFRKQQLDTYPTIRIWPDSVPAKPRDWSPMTASYVAPVNWHLPVYFDDISAERYGNHVGIFQPFLSAGKFYADFVLLPYRAWLTPPWQPISTEGLHRPGDPVPPVVFVPPVDWGATAAAVGWWALWLSVVP